MQAASPLAVALYAMMAVTLSAEEVAVLGSPPSPFQKISFDAVAQAIITLQTYPEHLWSSFLPTLSTFRMEGLLGLSLLANVIVSFLGRRANKCIARSVILAVTSVLREEFAGVGFNNHLFVLDGGHLVKSYATWRRAFDRAWLHIKLPSRQNSLSYLGRLSRIWYPKLRLPKG
ncbi:BQ2448_6210 [Microbotryum intermedium]|uniref:BQ2448_6210 protein n=1 Tax=Microbotryum intermedium TaxID=269621 RepID=A0A238FJ16_9BASI|nr:BQ2448_6210 [Microbotryum intermedium]